jgi:predicted Zn-dependent peptidase
MSEYEIHEFSNGIRLVHKQVSNTKISHCGFVLDIGSRDEQENQLGLAHFWEHMAFKGTQKRKSYHILSLLDSVGGELNAYTTKEKICFYASTLETHFEKSLDLLTDITFFSTFPEKEIKKEKSVILEEMSMYLDDHAESMQDQFDELVFQDHILGKNILGTTESVSNFTRADFLEFIDQNLSNDRIIFSSVSTLPMKKVVALANKYIADLPTKQATLRRKHFENYKKSDLQVAKVTSQAHCTVGSVAYSLYDKQRIAFFLLNNLLGGTGMNSRLNLTLREKHGLVYTIESNYQAFVDTGLFSIYFGTEKSTLEKSLNLVAKELNMLREQKLGTLQLHKAKQQLMGQLAMAEESNIGMMLMMGKSILDTNKIETLNEIFTQIQDVTAEMLCQTANEVFATDKLSSLVYMPN